MADCPVHHVAMLTKPTQYGPRHYCPVAGCDVMCWGGSTSTPADKATRDARIAAHVEFNRMAELIPKGAAYRWLAQEMGLDQKKCHIGMFNIDQCKQVVRLILARTDLRTKLK